MRCAFCEKAAQASYFPFVFAVVFAFCFAFASGGFLVSPASAQDPSPEDRNAVAAIEKAGGKVFRISKAGPEREVSFYLSPSPVTDEQIAAIAKLENVIWVNIAGTNVTSDGLKHLSGLPLQKLHLEKTAIGDDGLALIKDIKSLEYLNLYGTKVTDAGLKHLHGISNLKKLYVWQSGVTEEGIAGLNKVLPDLEIVGELKFEVKKVEKAPPKKKAEQEKKKSEGNKEKPKKGAEAKKGESKDSVNNESKEKKSKEKESGKNESDNKEPEKDAGEKLGGKEK